MSPAMQGIDWMLKLDRELAAGMVKVAQYTFDAAGVDSASASNKTIAAHGTGVFIPDSSIVVGGFFEVNTLFTSAGGDAGTIAQMVQGAGDIQAAAAVSGAPYSTIGRKAIVPKMNTPESTSIKLSALREIICTVAVQALLTGKLTGYLFYLDGVPSA